jgi:hypothetical protein
MGLIYDSNEEQQDSNTTREPLLDITNEPLPADEAEPSFGLHRRSLSELQRETPEQSCGPELKPQRPKRAAVQEDRPEELEAEPAPPGLIDLNTLPDTQEQPGSPEPPCSTEAEPVLEQAQPRGSRPRLKTPRAPVTEPPQAETDPDGLVDLDGASEGRTPTPGPGRRRSARSAPVPDEPEATPKTGRRRLTSSASVPEQPEATSESGRRRLTSSASVPEEPEATPRTGRRRLTSSASVAQEPEAAPESDRPPMLAPEAEAVEPKVKAHRRRLGEQKTATDESESGEQSRLDPAKVQEIIAQLKARQNFPLALLAGIPAMAVSGVLWTVVTVATNYRFAYMALAVGFLVGGAVRVSGRGLGRSFGWLGAGLSIGGCLLGNFLTNCVFIARETDLPLTKVLEHLSESVTAGLGLMVAVHPIDLIFFGIAIYEGYRFSFRRLTEARIARLA